jgi:peptide chain release factor 1
MVEWNILKEEVDKLSARLVDASLDTNTRKDLQKRVTHYSTLLSLHNDLLLLEQEKLSIEKQFSMEHGDMKELFRIELDEIEAKIRAQKDRIENVLYPQDRLDQRSVFLEIRAGTGGQEAALFGADLFKMYNNYALAQGWQVEIVDQSSTDIGGFKELIIHIKGEDVYRKLKYESGVHRVQRVPQTETQGRIHTSTATVIVLPEAEEVDMHINPSDLRIDVFRSSGAGGQHVNTTDSAVRIVHIPTGVMVTCQDERSQHKNKARALKVLRSRLLEAEMQRQEDERRKQRKQQVSSADRAEKIRTYNYPQNRISDHRIELTLKKLDIVMQGDMADLVDPLLAWGREEKRKEAELFKV